MNRLIFFVLCLFALLTGCEEIKETPLHMPVASEPSANLHNKKGIEYFNSGDYLEAYMEFNTANMADPTSGEVHYNLAITLLVRGEPDRAKGHFAMARKYAEGNEKILNSDLLNQYSKKSE